MANPSSLAAYRWTMTTVWGPPNSPYTPEPTMPITDWPAMGSTATATPSPAPTLSKVSGNNETEPTLADVRALIATLQVHPLGHIHVANDGVARSTTIRAQSSTSCL